MNPAEVIALYDATVRARPTVLPGSAVEQVDGVVRIVGPFNLITAWDLAGQSTARAVARQAAAFTARGAALMWRLHAHDQPADLAQHLVANGFVADPPATLMALDLAEAAISPPAGVDIRRVLTTEDLEDAIAASGRAFGRPDSWQRAAFTPRLGTPDLMLFTAYVDGAPVASARLETGDGGAFGGLYGGGVAPEHRGRGLYRALVAVRAQAARAAGLRYLATEARETSRPILQRLGFQPLEAVTTWILPAR